MVHHGVVATAGPVAPLLITLYINVNHLNQMAFSQDSLFRGYAHRWKQAQTGCASCIAVACQQCDNSRRHNVGVSF